jgi:hypothetical protein
MSVLSVTTTFPVADGPVANVATNIFISPAAGAGQGRGRLIHPNPELGTFDYLREPDAWVNIDGDAIIPPVWSTSKTLLGASNTLFTGDLRDVIVEELWSKSSVCMELSQARMLIAMWQNPPDPSVAYVQWWPTYANTLGYNVVILDLSIGGNSGIQLDGVTKSGIGWVRGPVRLKMRVCGRVV